MPVGTRIRDNSVFGVITDNPLTIGATTMNSSGLQNLSVVAGNHAVITLDPLRQHGEPEIVIVTAHTASATVATIQRGAYGTVARQHPQGTVWVHAPIDEDVIEIATSSTRPTDPYEGQKIFETDTDFYMGWGGSAWEFGHKLGAWIPYTPTWTNVTLGTGAINNGAFVRVGRTIHWRAFLKLGTSPAVTGLIQVSLPVTATANEDQGFGTLMSGRVLISDANGAFYVGTSLSLNTTTTTIRVLNTTLTYLILESATTGVPITWAVNDEIAIWGSYEAAS